MTDTSTMQNYEDSFRELREKLIRILGTPTVNRLIERAAIEIEQPHPAMRNLRWEDDDISFTAVREAMRPDSDADPQASYTALNGVLLLLVARLLGRELALRLTEGVSVSDLLESKVIGHG